MTVAQQTRSKISRQTAFNWAWNHFVVNGQQCGFDEDGHKLYYDSITCRVCVLGLLMPQAMREAYAGKVMDSHWLWKSCKQWRELFTKSDSRMEEFLNDLQTAHDGSYDTHHPVRSVMKMELTKVAVDHKLYVPKT